MKNPRTCAICGELESASEAWEGTHRYGPVEHGPFVPHDVDRVPEFGDPDYNELEEQERLDKQHDEDDEEEARAALQGLGFAVARVEAFTFAGWSIERNGDGWGVWELHDSEQFGRTRSSASGRRETIAECVSWLSDHAEREGAR